MTTTIIYNPTVPITRSNSIKMFENGDFVLINDNSKCYMFQWDTDHYVQKRIAPIGGNNLYGTIRTDINNIITYGNFTTHDTTGFEVEKVYSASLFVGVDPNNPDRDLIITPTPLHPYVTFISNDEEHRIGTDEYVPLGVQTGSSSQ